MNTEEKDREQELVSKNVGLVYRVIGQMYRQGRMYSWEVEDMTQEGMIGLLKAARNYKPEVGVSFATFATKCITVEVSGTLADMNREKRAGNRKHEALERVVLHGGSRGEIRLMDVIPSAVDVEEEALGLKMQELEAVFAGLGQEEWWEILKRKADGETLEEIGKNRGVTKQCIGMLVQKARGVVRREMQKRGAE